MRLSINNLTVLRVARELEAQLVELGHRMTAPRRAVLREVAGWAGPFTAGELLEAVLLAAPETGRATVFRTLDLLVELGALQKVHTEPGGNWGHRYVLCGLGEAHHHHLVCNSCGQVADFDGCLLDEALISEAARLAGFEVQGHHLELYGLCSACKED